MPVLIHTRVAAFWMWHACTSSQVQVRCAADCAFLPYACRLRRRRRGRCSGAGLEGSCAIVPRARDANLCMPWLPTSLAGLPLTAQRSCPALQVAMPRGPVRQAGQGELEVQVRARSQRLVLIGAAAPSGWHPGAAGRQAELPLGWATPFAHGHACLPPHQAAMPLARGPRAGPGALAGQAAVPAEVGAPMDAAHRGAWAPQPSIPTKLVCNHFEGPSHVAFSSSPNCPDCGPQVASPVSTSRQVGWACGILWRTAGRHSNAAGLDGANWINDAPPDRPALIFLCRVGPWHAVIG